MQTEEEYKAELLQKFVEAKGLTDKALIAKVIIDDTYAPAIVVFEDRKYYLKHNVGIVEVALVKGVLRPVGEG